MSCSQFTPMQLEAMLQNQLSQSQQDDIMRHLQTECESCYEFLATLPDDTVLNGLIEDGALSQAEQAKIFSAALPKRIVPKKSSSYFFQQMITLLRHRWIPVSVGIAFVFLMGVQMVYFGSRGKKEDPITGIKGNTPAASKVIVNLFAFKGQMGLSGHSTLLPFSNQSTFDKNNYLLFRYELSSSAYLYLAICDTAELLWFPDTSKEIAQKGNHEITAEGKALALPYRPSIPGSTLVLYASTEYVQATSFKQMLLESRCFREQAKVCSSCATDFLSIQPSLPSLHSP